MKKITQFALLCLVSMPLFAGKKDMVYEYYFKYLMRGDSQVFFKKIQPYFKSGHSGAQYGVANDAYSKGDIDKARNLWEAAVSKGNGCAANNLGMTYLRQHDLQMAVYWFKKGAELGDGRAIANYARQIPHDSNIENRQEYIDLNIEAMKKGEACGATALGLLYADAHDPLYDKEKAYYYLSIGQWRVLTGCPFDGFMQSKKLASELGEEKATQIREQAQRWLKQYPIPSLPLYYASCYKSA